MRYLSLDIETTGLDPVTCQILEVAAVLEDTAKSVPVEELPCFHRFISHKEIHGQLQGVAMNARLIETIAACQNGEFAEGTQAILPSSLFGQSKAFCNAHDLKRATVAGKNVSRFDVPFLCRLPGDWESLFDHRTIDPAILFWQPKADSALSSMSECLYRAGLAKEVAHRALDDARDVVSLVRIGMSRMKGRLVSASAIRANARAASTEPKRKKKSCKKKRRRLTASCQRMTICCCSNDLRRKSRSTRLSAKIMDLI